MANYVNSFEQCQTCGLRSLDYEYYVKKHYKTRRHRTRVLCLLSQGHYVTDYNIRAIFSDGFEYKDDNEYQYDDDVVMEDIINEDDVESMSFTNDTFSLGCNDEEYLGGGSVAEDDFDSDSRSEYSELGSYTFTFRANPFFSFKNELSIPVLLFFKSGQDKYSLTPYNVNIRATRRRARNNTLVVVPGTSILGEPYVFEDTSHGDRGSLCNHLKTHLLFHLENDIIIRFAGGAHVEAEKGE